MPGEYPDPEQVDWRRLEHSRMQAVSGVAHSVHLIAQAIDDLGARIAATDRGNPWRPISDRIPAWPDERDPAFLKEPPRCAHGHPLCCGHHDLEDMPIHRVGRCHGPV